jgi:hypothetical protein
MSDRFSAAWWNEQAQSAGKLYRKDIESLTGLQFRNVFADPNDPTRGFISNWHQDVRARAPGFADAGLALGVSTPEPYPPLTDIEAQLTWPEATFYVSQVGFVAPGATGAWNPILSDVYVEPSGAPAPEPWEVTVGAQTTTDTPLFVPEESPAIIALEPDASGGAGAVASVPGVAPSGADGTTETPAAGAAADVPSAGLSVSGKVLAVVALLVLGVYLTSRPRRG